MTWSTFVPQLPRQLWLLASAAFVNFLGYMVMPFLVLYLTQVDGFSVEVAGVLLTLFGIGNIIGAWTGGQLSDKIGSANVLIWSFVASAATMATIPSLAGVLPVGAGLCVLAIANGAFRPAYDACVVRLCPKEERPRAYAVYVIAINIGAGAAAAMAGHLYASNPHMIFYADALTSFLAAAAVFLFLDRSSHGAAAREEQNEVADNSQAPYKSAVFLIVCLAACIVDAVAKQTSATLPLYVNSAYGMTPQAFGNLLTAGYILFAAAVLPVSAWVKSKNQLKFAILGMCIVAIGFGALPIGASVQVLVFLYVLITIGQLFFYPAIMAVVMEQAAQGGKSGAYMGFYRTMQAAAGVVAPIVGTFVYTQAGPSTLWLGCSLLTFVIALTLGYAKLTTPRPVPQV